MQPIPFLSFLSLWLLVSCQTEWNSNTKKNGEVKGKIYFIAEQMPRFPQGDVEGFRTFVSTHTRYPEAARKAGIQGKVFVQFVVDIDGSIKQTLISKPVHPLLDEEALRVIRSSPQWIPGKHKGKKVAVQLTFPVFFTLPQD